MRETAIDIGKWINGGNNNKGNSGHPSMNTTTHNEISSFMEQRLNRN